MTQRPRPHTKLPSQSSSSRVSHQGAIASCSWPIAQLPGLSESDRQNLVTCNVKTTQDLLKRGHTAENQHALAAQLKIHPQYLKKWVALADLSRIPRVGCQYCGLLLHAGIISPKHLVQTSLPRLHQQLVKLYVAELRDKSECPSLSEVRLWQQQAHHLTP